MVPIALITIYDVIIAITIRGGQKSKKLEFEWADCFFPLHCVSGVTKKNFSSLALIFHPPLAPYIIQRKFQKIHGKILKVSFYKFWAVKLIHKLFSVIGLHSWSSDASFDTHITISRHHKCRYQMRHLCLKCQKCHFWRICHPTHMIYR